MNNPMDVVGMRATMDKVYILRESDGSGKWLVDSERKAKEAGAALIDSGKGCEIEVYQNLGSAGPVLTLRWDEEVSDWIADVL